MSVRVVVCLVLLKISLSDCVPFDAMSHEDQLFSSRFRERDFCFCRFSGSSGKLMELGSAAEAQRDMEDGARDVCFAYSFLRTRVAPTRW